MQHLLKRLVIDSATPTLYIGLFEGDRCVGEFYEKGHNDHSVKLMKELEVLMNKQQWVVADLDAIVVGNGPGSYTGLRIGVVVAKMLAFAKNIPLYTVSSLALLASGVSQEGQLLPWMDARRNHAFCAVYKYENKTLTLFKPARYTEFNTFVSTLEGTVVKVDEAKPNMPLIFASGLMEKVDNIHHLAPIYLRETEAERNLHANN